MKGKLERHRIIREVLMAGRIASQEELASVLAERGVDVAQATLSRDIKELRMSKLHDENGCPGQHTQHRVFRSHNRDQDPSRTCEHGGFGDRFQPFGCCGGNDSGGRYHFHNSKGRIRQGRPSPFAWETVQAAGQQEIELKEYTT